MGCVIKGRTVNFEIKKALRDSIIVPTLTYVSETLTWNEGQRARDPGSGDELSERCLWSE